MSKKHFSTALWLLLTSVVFFALLSWVPVHSGQRTAYSSETYEADSSRIRFQHTLDSLKAVQIDDLLNQAYRKGTFNGQVLYAENGQILYRQCFGFSNIRSRKDSLCNQSAFQLASLSKPFTAVAVMKLYQNGKIDIYKPVKEYLPDFPFEEVTVVNLLQHRSGLKNYIYIAEKYWPDKKKALQNKDISPLLARYGKTLDFKPGSRFRYCNTNYAYLALLVETISGQPFARYFNDSIARPLGMENTFLYDHTNPQPEGRKMVTGFSYSRRTGFYKRYPDYLDGVVGDKGLFSTAEDIFRFDQALYDTSFLADSIRKLMFTPAEPLDSKHDNDYGMGFRIRQDTGGYQTVFHNGWWKGFRTYFIHDYLSQRTLIWLNNRSDVTINPYIEKIFDIVGSSYLAEPSLAKNQPVEENMEENPEEEREESKMTDEKETYGSQE